MIADDADSLTFSFPDTEAVVGAPAGWTLDAALGQGREEPPRPDALEAPVRPVPGVDEPRFAAHVHGARRLQAGVRAVKINGVALTVESVNEGLFPYARQLRLYTDSHRESSAARDFIQFVQSAEGQRVLEEMGYVRRFEPKLPAMESGGF